MTGYESKRAAARDKLDNDDTLTIAYQNGYYDGKKAAAQEPTKYSFRAQWEEDGCIGVVAAIERLDGGVHLLKDTIDAPQPVQEPVAYLCKPDQHGLFDPPTPDKACKDCFPVYRQSPQRPWVELEGEEIRLLWEEATKPEDRSTMTMVTSFAKDIEAKLKEKNNAA